MVIVHSGLGQELIKTDFEVDDHPFSGYVNSFNQLINQYPFGGSVGMEKYFPPGGDVAFDFLPIG